MAEITADLVKTLRDATNVSMMECKRALMETGGDIEKATRVLRERGISVAAKKSSRATNQGLIATSSTDAGKTVCLVEINCETDFVARNEGFVTFVRSLAAKACASDAALSDLCKDEVIAKIAEIGENIVARRNVRFTLQGPGVIDAYIHLGGKVGVLVELGCTKPETASNASFKELARDIALQIAAASPRYLAPEDVPAAEIASEREIFAKQVQDKPANIVEKIVDGKMRKFYEEACLVDQLFVKEQKTTIKALLAEKSKTLGDTVAVRRFVRYQLGQ